MGGLGGVRTGGCDRAERSWATSAVSFMRLFDKQRDHRDHRSALPRVFVRFEGPAEPPAEWHVGQFRNRRKVGPPHPPQLHWVTCFQSNSCCAQSSPHPECEIL